MVIGENVASKAKISGLSIHKCINELFPEAARGSGAWPAEALSAAMSALRAFCDTVVAKNISSKIYLVNTLAEIKCISYSQLVRNEKRSPVFTSAAVRDMATQTEEKLVTASHY